MKPNMDAKNLLANQPDLLSGKTLDELTDEICLLSAHIQAATCRLLLLIAEMDRREGYGELGFLSCAHWLSHFTGEQMSTAREKVRVARKLVEFPRIVDAFSSGRLSFSKVRAITRIVTPENEETLLEQGLAQRQGKARPSTYQVLVHVDETVLAGADKDPGAEGICEVEGGVGVSAETSRRLSCDAPVLEVPDVTGACCDGHQGKGCKLDLGQSRRRPSAALERAVRGRDRGACQFPGCESRGYLQIHHIKHWAVGGATSLDNLTILCGAHHRAVHEGGFTVRRGEDGALRFFNPDGVRLLNSPMHVVLPDDPVQALLAQGEALELEISERTGVQSWDGFDRVDYGEAVDCLMMLRSSA